tara:strand:- start:364 stop:1161 length:798 start_codon:yes stop_codon:yes gene_type:complete
MSVIEIGVSTTVREGYLYAWRYCVASKDCDRNSAESTAAYFGTVRDLENASSFRTTSDLGVGAYWDPVHAVAPKIIIFRTFIQFTVPSGIDTSGTSAVLKLYGRSQPAPASIDIFSTATSPVTVADIQIFACDTIPNLKKSVYSSFTSTTYSDRITGISSDPGWVEINLNSDALTAIGAAAGGRFDLCIREYSHDVLNSDPGISSDVSYFWQFASMKTATLAPRIIVQPAGFNHNLLGIAKTSISKVNNISMASPQDIERINDIQ